MMDRKIANGEWRMAARLTGASLAVVLIVIFAVSWIAGPGARGYSLVPSLLVGTAYAEDDEDDEEEDDEEEDKDEKEEKTTETRYVTHYEVRQVPKTVTVIPTEYETDTDGDRLVDALDPDPDTHQREYFTDDDGDVVPNAFDRYPGEDDFAYFDSMYDTNDDGIVDSFEGLARK